MAIFSRLELRMRRQLGGHASVTTCSAKAVLAGKH
jgi:hypothetical protein